MRKIKRFILSGKFLYDSTTAILLWYGLSIFTIIQNLVKVESSINNYKIYAYSYKHFVQGLNIYSEYPLHHADVFLYGPSFTMLIFPFTLLPDSIGFSLWVLANVSALFFAINNLPLKKEYKNAILVLSSHEMMNSSSWLQFNGIIAACIILGFIYIHKNKEWLALFFIVFATLTKVYGIVAFAFFLVSNNKTKFIFSSIFWFILIGLSPIIFKPFNFLQETYSFWIDALIHKDNKNMKGASLQYFFQDIDVMGLIRRNIDSNFNKDFWVIGFGCLLFSLKIFAYKHFDDLRFKIYMLCSVLIFVVIFSTGAESPTYIIAFPACCIWYIIQNKSKQNTAFFVFCLIVVSFSYSDLLTKYSREFSMQHSLKALPCLLLWLVIIYQILSKQFLKINLEDGLKLSKSTE